MTAFSNMYYIKNQERNSQLMLAKLIAVTSKNCNVTKMQEITNNITIESNYDSIKFYLKDK